MELKRIVVQLLKGTGEYDDFVDADLRSSIRQVEVHGAESAGEGVIRIPKGMVIESLSITDDYLLVRAAESVPGAISRAARAVIDSAVLPVGKRTYGRWASNLFYEGSVVFLNIISVMHNVHFLVVAQARTSEKCQFRWCTPIFFPCTPRLML